MKIFLVGLSGSGKTTLGKQLADVLHVPFIDMDWEIEQRENKSVNDIFSQQGENYFRQVESTVLRELAASTDSYVMGTGGGAPCFYDGMSIIKDAGLSIFFDVPVKELISRLQHATDRPLLNTSEVEREKKLQALLEARLPIYRQAHIIIKDPTLEKVVNAIHLKSKPKG
jgi:shikimate kinase